MTLFAFREVKSHGWTFYDPIKDDGFARSHHRAHLKARKSKIDGQIFRLYLRIVRELVTTETELKAMAALATMGLSRIPVKG